MRATALSVCTASSDRFLVHGQRSIMITECAIREKCILRCAHVLDVTGSPSLVTLVVRGWYGDLPGVELDHLGERECSFFHLGGLTSTQGHCRNTPNKCTDLTPTSFRNHILLRFRPRYGYGDYVNTTHLQASLAMHKAYIAVPATLTCTETHPHTHIEALGGRKLIFPGSYQWATESPGSSSPSG